MKLRKLNGWLWLSISLLYVLGSHPSLAQQDKEEETSLRIVTWNVCNFGKSKSKEEIQKIANIVRDADVLAIQEVSTTESGAQATASLADELDRKGFDWDYRISNATSGEGTERYAFLWKTSKVQPVGDGFLETSCGIADSIDREPFIQTFKELGTGKTFTLVSIHTVPTTKKPEQEIKFLYKIDSVRDSLNLMFMGDFNYSEKQAGFKSLKERGYEPAITGQKTSLKQKVGENGETLAKEYDNIFYEEEVFELDKAGVKEFHTQFESLSAARQISDHLPVWAVFRFK